VNAAQGMELDSKPEKIGTAAEFFTSVIRSFVLCGTCCLSSQACLAAISQNHSQSFSAIAVME